MIITSGDYLKFCGSYARTGMTSLLLMKKEGADRPGDPWHDTFHAPTNRLPCPENGAFPIKKGITIRITPKEAPPVLVLAIVHFEGEIEPRILYDIRLHLMVGDGKYRVEPEGITKIEEAAKSAGFDLDQCRRFPPYRVPVILRPSSEG